MATDPPWTRGHPPFGWRWKRSAAALAHAGAGADGLAGAAEDVLDDAAEGEDDDDDQGRDAGDEQAVLHGGRAALVHLGNAGVEHEPEVVQHFRSPTGVMTQAIESREGRRPPGEILLFPGLQRIPLSIRAR